MTEQRPRDRAGKFVQKSDEIRKVRSIRLTDRAWEYLGESANDRGITRADLVEEYVESGFFDIKENLESLPQEKVEESEDDDSTRIPTKEELEGLMEAALKTLKVGSQSKQYKDAKKAFKLFIDKLLSEYYEE